MLISGITIFFCRILDVSLGTVRMLLTVRGKTFGSAVLGFIEVFVWFMVVRGALSSAEGGWFIAIFYAGGFATGTYIGGKISSKFIKGLMSVNIVLSNCTPLLLEKLREAGFGATQLKVAGSGEDADEKTMLICEIYSSRLSELQKIIKDHDPSAFFMVQETKVVSGGFLK